MEVQTANPRSGLASLCQHTAGSSAPGEYRMKEQRHRWSNGNAHCIGCTKTGMTVCGRYQERWHTTVQCVLQGDRWLQPRPVLQVSSHKRAQCLPQPALGHWSYSQHPKVAVLAFWKTSRILEYMSQQLNKYIPIYIAYAGSNPHFESANTDLTRAGSFI